MKVLTWKGNNIKKIVEQIERVGCRDFMVKCDDRGVLMVEVEGKRVLCRVGESFVVSEFGVEKMTVEGEGGVFGYVGTGR